MEERKYFVYKFEELTEEQKKKALKNYSDINVDHDWWDSTYEDAENVGLKITSFDLYHNSIMCGFVIEPEDVALKIIKDHGEHCETYKSAKAFLAFKDVSAFFKNICNNYLKMLQTDYDYLTSDYAIEETFIANDYWFTENGKID